MTTTSENTAKLFATINAVAPALATITEERVVQELWSRPGLAPRDRALVTVAALAALGQSRFYPDYLNRAKALGVTQQEFGEALGHVAFYGGWGLAVQASLDAADW